MDSVSEALAFRDSPLPGTAIKLFFSNSSKTLPKFQYGFHGSEASFSATGATLISAITIPY